MNAQKAKRKVRRESTMLWCGELDSKKAING